MEIRERLERCRTLRRETQEMRERLEELREDMVRCTAVPMTGMPGGGRRENDRIGAALARAEELAGRLACRIAETEAALQRAEDMLDGLPAVQRRIMQLRYIQGMDWIDVAEEEHYSERHCRRLHDEAARSLEEAEKRMSDNVRQDRATMPL